MSFLNSDKVKRPIVDMLRKLAEKSDNTVDDAAVDVLERGGLVIADGFRRATGTTVSTAP